MIKSYPYALFIQKNWLSVKDKKLPQKNISLQDNIDQFRENLTGLGVEVASDIIDWRIYSLLLFSVVARKKFKVIPDWIPERVDISRAEECYQLWDVISAEDKAQHFSNLRTCIENNDLNTLSKLGLLLRCRFELHLDTDLSTYIPLYLALYARVIKDPYVLNKVVTKHRAWGVLSCLHYFPRAIAGIEYSAFPDQYNWFLSNFFILSNLLDEEPN